MELSISSEAGQSSVCTVGPHQWIQDKQEHVCWWKTYGQTDPILYVWLGPGSKDGFQTGEEASDWGGIIHWLPSTPDYIITTAKCITFLFSISLHPCFQGLMHGNLENKWHTLYLDLLPQPQQMITTTYQPFLQAPQIVAIGATHQP